jgi:hypothetical protein
MHSGYFTATPGRCVPCHGQQPSPRMPRPYIWPETQAQMGQRFHRVCRGASFGARQKV